MGVGRWRPGHLYALLLVVALGAAPSWAENVHVRLKTDRGEMIFELYPERAPATVANFLSYANRYFYDGLIFHRVVKDFVIQSGGYTFDLTKKTPAEPIPNEAANGLRNLRGTIAMARHADPDSATSQFYINLRDNPNLDPTGDKPGYTVFGRIIEGFEVAQSIGDVAVEDSEQLTHLPREPVQILSVREIDSP